MKRSAFLATLCAPLFVVAKPKREPMVIYRKRYEKNPEWRVICEEHHGDGTYTKYVDGKLIGTFKTAYA